MGIFIKLLLNTLAQISILKTKAKNVPSAPWVASYSFLMVLFLFYFFLKGPAHLNPLSLLPSQPIPCCPTIWLGMAICIQLVGTCHNPIFTPEIFSDVDTQNEIARTELAWPKRGPVTLKNSQKHGRECISWAVGKFDQVDQVWPRPWLDQKQDLIDYPLTIG